VRRHLANAIYHHDQSLTLHLVFLLVIAFFLFQIYFCTIFILPTQGFFNALIYFHVAMRKPRRVSTPETSEHTNPSFTDPAPPFRQWENFRRSFSRRRSSGGGESADPLAAVTARVPEEEDLQDLEEEKPVVDQIDRDGATEGSRIPSDLVGMELHSRTIPEANLEH
jgi:hypothetical protein